MSSHDDSQADTTQQRAFNRRRFIQGIGATGLAGLAGCLGGGDDNDTATPSESGDGTTTEADEETPTPDDGGPFFAVSNLSPAETTIYQRAGLEVSVTITNTGTDGGEQEIEVLVGDSVVATRTVSLSDGESTDLAFEDVPVEEFESAEHTHAVASTDDRQEGTLTIEEGPPNVVFIMADDMGYGDTSVEPFTSEKFGDPIPTPNLEEMAANGARFTSNYTGPAPVCTPTRAALMTGSYHARAGVGKGVYFPGDDTGMHPQEMTIADLVQAEGYATGMVGKWHLGDDDPYLPANQGFEESYVAPYSNDMSPPIPLIDGLETLTTEAPNARLTQRYTEQALQFIEDHQDEPFFLYLPHSMPHVPIDVSEEFAGETGMGEYPDVIHELDWSTGQILDRLEELGIEEDTLVVFTSDDGSWNNSVHSTEETSGSTGPLRASKGSIYEGGARTPTIMQWPGTIPEDTVCEEMTSFIDVLPTVANLMGADLPDYTIDGMDITEVIQNPESASTPRDHLLYYQDDQTLKAIRNAEGYKYHIDGDELYDLEEDIGEENDISGDNPDIVSTLQDRATTLNEEVKENARPEGTRSNIAYVSIGSAGNEGLVPGEGAVVTFTNNTDAAVTDVEVSVSIPDDGWEASINSDASIDSVDAGGTVDVDVDLSAGDSEDGEVFVHAVATYQGEDGAEGTRAGETFRVFEPLPEAFSTFNNGSDDPLFAKDGDAFVIEGRGAVIGEDDAYTALYLEDGLSSEGTATVKVASMEATNQWDTGDLVVRNDITKPGESAGYAMLSAGDQNAQTKIDESGDGHMQGEEISNFESGLPRWLRFERNGTTFVASQSPDGSDWTEIANFELEEANETMDVGMTVTSGSDGDARVTFENFEV
jgi:arylsulfatase A-like enzyme